ncbi:hypothetical protein KTI63_03260 [Acinetobacter guillouiae]|uniref:hypothetical protein n=1 Tax=Acinetobacter guillouiae TaxID=106649 RepID=UPI0021D34008|nr:hypothetical protein [Acinetobacter guillouiae]MCU4491484.1 hypothetical protein [Acinetobacter guillouiae]
MKVKNEQKGPTLLTTLILEGSENLEIKLRDPTFDKQRNAVTVFALSKYFMEINGELNSIQSFIDQLKSKYTSFKLKNNKGKEYQIEINARLLNSITKTIKGLMVVKMIDEGQIKL